MAPTFASNSPRTASFGGALADGADRRALDDAIGVNASILGERPTGLGVFVRNAVPALAALGERLVVYTSRPESFAASPIETRRAPVATRPEWGTCGHMARLLWQQAWLRRALPRDRVGVLLNLMPEGLLRPGLPQVVTVYDLLPLHFPQAYPRQRHYYRHVLPALLRSARAIVTISEASRRDLRRFYAVPDALIHVAPCGHDPARFRPDGAPTRQDAPFALYVGNILPHKNVVRLVEAFARAAPAPGPRLVIVGRGRPDHVALVRARVETLDLHDRLEWREYVDDDELIRLYRGARMLVLPSLWEGFGLSALEAMACGTPVVASNRASLPEVVGDAGLLVDPLDTGALAAAMARLFRDHELAGHLRERSLTRATHFLWDRTARAIRDAVRAAAETGAA